VEGPGIESKKGARNSSPLQTGPEAQPASNKMDTVLFLGVKADGT